MPPCYFVDLPLVKRRGLSINEYFKWLTLLRYCSKSIYKILLTINIIIMKKRSLLFSFLLAAGIFSASAAVGDKYEAEAFDEASGARAEATNVGYITNGTWVKFNSISFDGTEQWIEVSASGTAGGNIEFRLGAPDGTLIGTAVMTGTSGWSDYKIFKADITQTTGDQVLYLVFTGGDGYLFNVGDFKLNAEVPFFEITTSASPANSGFAATDVDTNFVSQGSDVLFYAQRGSGYAFSHWEDGSGNTLSSDNPTTVKISAAVNMVAVFQPQAEVPELPSWTFDNQYFSTGTEEAPALTPAELPITSRPPMKGAMIYPDNYPASGSAYMTSNSDTLFTAKTGDYETCRLLWAGANTVDDFTDGSQHKQYLEFRFSTLEFVNVGITFYFSGGQSDVNDYLEMVYSVDGGTTWIDNGAFYSEAHWNTWVPGDADLTGADNKELVIVRLIGISTNVGDNLNFNVDDLSILGTATPVSDVTSTPAASVITGAGFIQVSVEKPTFVAVYSIDGKMVKQAVVSTRSNLTVQPGIYLVKTGNSQVTKVLVTE